ncbi:MAG: hypothetical protein GYA43_06445 [Bacteroidales bacterium]|nr:hypothetical protein [Bacteroidales bacterium]
MRRKIVSVVIFFAVINLLYGQPAPDYLLRAKALTDTGKPEEALAVLSSEIQKGAGADALIMRAEIFFNAGNTAMAEKDYSASLSSLPGQSNYGLARVYAIRREPAKSIKYLIESLRYENRKNEREIMLEKAFTAIDNTPEWRQFWQNYSFPEEDARLSEVEYYLSSGKVTEAQKIAGEMAGKSPGSTKSLYAKALVDFYLQKYQDVLSSLQPILKQESRNTEYLNLQAKAQMASGNAAGASLTYTRIIETGIADATPYLRRAECYYKTGEYQKALTDINKYLDFYQSSKEAIKMAGKVSIALGDNIKAISYFTRNIELYPLDASCYIDRAGAYFTARSWALASDDYGMSLDLDPGNAEAWLNKGIAVVNTGMTGDACYYFNRAFILGNRQASSWINRYCIK